MSDAATIPDDMAARVARLINEAEDMRQQAADDLKQIYADLREELRRLGWDGKHVSAEVAALKGAIGEMRLDEKAKEKREEKGERVDDYVSLLTRARARGGNSYAAASRSDAGLNIVTKHTEITASPETATVPSSEQSEGNGSRDHQHVHSRQTDGAKHGGQDGEPAGADHATYSPETAEGETGMVLGTGRERPLSIGLHTDGDPEARFETASLHQDQQMDRATEGSFETGSEAAEKGREAIPAGPEGADLSHAGAGESPATASKPKVSFRPNCLQPEMCRSGTRDHCYSCRKAMAQHEDAA